MLAFIVVTHSPKSGLLVSTFISCLQDLRAIVGSCSAGLSKLSLVQLGFPGLSSALCVSSSGTEVEESMLVSW